MERMKGRVMEADVSEDEYESLHETHKIVRVLQLSDGYRIQYLLNEEDQQEGNAVPDLEDAYLEFLV